MDSDRENSSSEFFEDNLSEIFKDFAIFEYVETFIKKEMEEYMDYKDNSLELFKLDSYNKFMHQSKTKYPLSTFYIEDIPKVIYNVNFLNKFGNDRWMGIPSLSERQQYNLIKEMQDFYYDALVERFCKITFSKCGSSVKSDDGEKLLLTINNHKDYFTIATAEKRQYTVPYFDHMFKNHTCGICEEQFVENKLVYQLNCKHAFHFTCVETRLKKITICPHCEELIVSRRQTEYAYKIKCSNYGYKYVDISLCTLPVYCFSSLCQSYSLLYQNY